MCMLVMKVVEFSGETYFKVFDPAPSGYKSQFFPGDGQVYEIGKRYRARGRGPNWLRVLRWRFLREPLLVGEGFFHAYTNGLGGWPIIVTVKLYGKGYVGYGNQVAAPEMELVEEI